ARNGRTRRTAAPSTASTGMRRNAAGVRAVALAGAARANSTGRQARIVTTVPPPLRRAGASPVAAFSRLPATPPTGTPSRNAPSGSPGSAPPLPRGAAGFSGAGRESAVAPVETGGADPPAEDVRERRSRV